MQRVLKFVKYLPEFGWEPIVITVDGGDFPAEDTSLIEEIPDSVAVHRVPALEPYSLYRTFTGKSQDAHIPVGTLAKGDSSSGWTERLARWIRANLFVPDARIAWTFPVVRQAKKLMSEYKVDAIFSSSPPHSVQLAARRIANREGLPWIADFRDPWTDIYYYQDLNRGSLTKYIDARLEQKVLQSADGVITVSPELVRNLRNKAPEQQFTQLPNGYDKSDFAEDHQHSFSKFSLAYIGNLKANQNPTTLWEVLAENVQNEPGFARDFELQLTGKIHPQVTQSLSHFGLTEWAHIDGYVPHVEATRQMQESAVLLFIVPEARENKGILTGKLFEYLAAGRPLLPIGPPDGDAATILNVCNTGSMLHYEDKKGLTTLISQLYSQWKAGDMTTQIPSESKVRQFERREQSRILSSLLNSVAEHAQ